VTWESALPADVFDDLLVDELVRTAEDLLATLELVTFLAMTPGRETKVFIIEPETGKAKTLLSVFQQWQTTGSQS
jgi:hypothetical protein